MFSNSLLIVPCIDKLVSSEFHINCLRTINDLMQIEYVIRYIDFGNLYTINVVATVTHFVTFAVVPHLGKEFRYNFTATTINSTE